MMEPKSTDVIQALMDQIKNSGYHPNAIIIPPMKRVAIKGTNTVVMIGDFLKIVK